MWLLELTGYVRLPRDGDSQSGVTCTLLKLGINLAVTNNISYVT